MARWLIITGIFMISTAIYLKYSLYIRTGYTPIKNNSTDNLDPAVKEQKIKQQNKLKDINNELTEIINDIARKEKQLRENVEQMNVAQYRLVSEENQQNSLQKNVSELQSKEQDDILPEDKDFQQVLDQNFNRIEDNSLPGKYKQVFKLDQQGKSPTEIAEELNLGVRETELILEVFHHFRW